MTSNQDSTTDADSLELPLKQTRRTLLQLLGSATTVGALTGTAAASHGDRDDGYKDKDAIHDSVFDWRGMAFRHDTMYIKKLWGAPACRKDRKNVFACKKLKMRVDDDTITKTHVKSVKMRKSLEKRLVLLVDHLADGKMPDNFDGKAKADMSHLSKRHKKYFKRLKKDFKKMGPARALEFRLKKFGKHKHDGCRDDGWSHDGWVHDHKNDDHWRDDHKKHDGKHDHKKHDDWKDDGKHDHKKHDDWKDDGKHDHKKHDDWKDDHGKHDHKKFDDWKDKHGDRKDSVLLFEIFLIFILIVLAILFLYE